MVLWIGGILAIVGEGVCSLPIDGNALKEAVCSAAGLAESTCANRGVCRVGNSNALKRIFIVLALISERYGSATAYCYTRQAALLYCCVGVADLRVLNHIFGILPWTRMRTTIECMAMVYVEAYTMGHTVVWIIIREDYCPS